MNILTATSLNFIVLLTSALLFQGELTQASMPDTTGPTPDAALTNYLLKCMEADFTSETIESCSLVLAQQERLPDRVKYAAYATRGESLRRNQQYDAAVSDFSQALEYAHDDQDRILVLEYRSTANFDANRISESMLDNRAILKLQPENAQANNSIAWTKYIMNDAKAALPYAEKAVGQNDAELHHFNTHAHILTELGEVSLAIQSFSTAASLDRGGYVRLLQEALRDYGFYTGPSDGSFGTITKQALRDCVEAKCRLLDDEARNEATRK